MTVWARYSTRWYLDPRVLELSAPAELMYARAIAYCKEELTDGIVSRGALSHLGAKLGNKTATCADEIIAVGLWLPSGSGFTFPPATWERWQGTKADVDTRRDQEAERKRSYRARRSSQADTNGTGPVVPPVSHRDNRDSPASRRPTRDTQPEPEPEPEPERDTESLSPRVLGKRAAQAGGERDLDAAVHDLADRFRLSEEGDDDS